MIRPTICWPWKRWGWWWEEILIFIAFYCIVWYCILLRCIVLFSNPVTI